MEWQPIATAPKTRQSILVYCKELQNTYIVYWKEWIDPPQWAIFGTGEYLEQIPTHWMPLPAPPTEKT